MVVHDVLQISSLLYIETADRPGLVVEIIKIIADINIDVESAEIDTEVFLFLSLFLSLAFFYYKHLFSHLTGANCERQIPCQLQRCSTKQFLVTGIWLRANLDIHLAVFIGY